MVGRICYNDLNMNRYKRQKPIYLVGFVILAIVLWNLGRSLYGMYQIRSEVSYLEDQVETLRLEKERVLAEKAYRESLDYVETEARNKLNLRKPEDTVISIDNNDLGTPDDTSIDNAALAVSVSSQWLGLLLRGLK